MLKVALLCAGVAAQQCARVATDKSGLNSGHVEWRKSIRGACIRVSMCVVQKLSQSVHVAKLGRGVEHRVLYVTRLIIVVNVIFHGHQVVHGVETERLVDVANPDRVINQPHHKRLRHRYRAAFDQIAEIIITHRYWLELRKSDVKQLAKLGVGRLFHGRIRQGLVRAPRQQVFNQIVVFIIASICERGETIFGEGVEFRTALN